MKDYSKMTDRKIKTKSGIANLHPTKRTRWVACKNGKKFIPVIAHYQNY